MSAELIRKAGLGTLGGIPAEHRDLSTAPGARPSHFGPLSPLSTPLTLSTTLTPASASRLS